MLNPATKVRAFKYSCYRVVQNTKVIEFKKKEEKKKGPNTQKRRVVKGGAPHPTGRDAGTQS